MSERVSELTDSQIEYLLHLPRGTSSLDHNNACQWLVVALENVRDARAKLAAWEPVVRAASEWSGHYRIKPRDARRQAFDKTYGLAKALIAAVDALPPEMRP